MGSIEGSPVCMRLKTYAYSGKKMRLEALFPSKKAGSD
jgi:hypothetical protein